jgi:membrane protein implicated in regulation of membrane protease activity
MSAWIWFGGAVLLAIAEVLGAEFVLLMLGGGALVTAGFALLFPELLWLQLLVFALASVALVLGLRPMLLRKYYQPAKIRSGIEAIIGSKATVVSTVDADGGQVKIGGEVWSAVILDGHRALPPGTSVTVVEVRGATAVVIWGP